MYGEHRWDIVQRIAAVVVIVAGILLTFVVLTLAMGFFAWSISPGRDMPPVLWALMPMFLAALCCLFATFLVGVGQSRRKPHWMFPIAAGSFALAAALTLSMALASGGDPGTETLFHLLAACAGILALITPWWRSFLR